MPSDIRIFVRFEDQCVFAGEELRCIITFRNVANTSATATPAFTTRRSGRQTSIGKIASFHEGSSRDYAASRINRTTTAPVSQPEWGTTRKDISAISNTKPDRGAHAGHKHQRSVSIISLNSPVESASHVMGPNASNQRIPMSHRRSSTIQVHTAKDPRPDQLRRGSSFGLGLSIPPSSGRRSPLSATGTSTPGAESRQSTPDFHFPAANQSRVTSGRVKSREPSPGNAQANLPSTQDERHVSSASQVPSERSSAEFYSLSNHSQETLMSEQPSVFSDQPQLPTNMASRHYRMKSQPPRRPQAANLLMGYAHLNATFTLDGSLVDQSQFEDVKKKGFLGGQAGGGVVGVNKIRPASGFMGSFNFGSIGESLNNLVGGDDMSSVKEMSAVSNSRAIPLLSTPQSLLFVDLRLEPGEEKNYSFNTNLPRGLPSSYRGKSIRISYNILVGVQGVPGGRDVHRVSQVNIPVRVFSGVNDDGEILGHDLMQPHILLKDPARTKSVDPTNIDESDDKLQSRKTGSQGEFLKYVDTLLDRNRRRQSSSSAMDASAPTTDAINANATVQAISRAVMLSNQLSTTNESSTNRFEIRREGVDAAVITLDRNLHRLGETVTAVIDFSETVLPCALLHATLETTEEVSQSLALRSAASLNRVTRRIYASHAENVLFSKRSVFCPIIPTTATPTFFTSGINLQWKLRFEIGTVRPAETEDKEEQDIPDLFDEVVNDERGTINIAVERMDCETFDVQIPLTVYGDASPSVNEGGDVEGIPL